MTTERDASELDETTQREPERRVDMHLIVFFLAFACLIFSGIHWNMPDLRSSAKDNLVLDGSWAYDGTDLSRQAIDVYPPFCYLQMELLFKPLRALTPEDAFKENPWKASSRFIVWARCISALYTLGTALLIFLICKSVINRESAFVASALYILNPATLYYAVTTNAEATVYFYTCLSLYCFVQARRNEKHRWHPLVFFLSAAVAVASKDQAGFFLLGPIIYEWVKHPKRAAVGSLSAAVLFFILYISWGGWDHFMIHIRAMRENATLHYQYGMSPPDLLKLSGLIIAHCFKVGHVLLLVLVAGIFIKQKSKTLNNTYRLMLLASVPYVLAILFLAHRSYPRFLMPLLPFIVIAAVIIANELKIQAASRKIVVGVLFGVLLSLAIAFKLHMFYGPRQMSKDYLRSVTAEKTVTLAVFTLRRGTQYKEDENGNVHKQNVTRDWFWERYGYVSDNVKILRLFPNDIQKLNANKPEFAVALASDGVPEQIDGYVKVKSFRAKFPALFSYIHDEESITIYRRVE